MSEDLKQEMELDICNFFRQIDNQNFTDQKETLKLLLDKYCHITKSDYMMDMHDLRSITSSAVGKASSNSMNKCLESGSRKVKLSQEEMIKIFIVESTIGHLNKKGCLKKMAKFDYKEDKF